MHCLAVTEGDKVKYCVLPAVQGAVYPRKLVSYIAIVLDEPARARVGGSHLTDEVP